MVFFLSLIGLSHSIVWLVALTDVPSGEKERKKKKAKDNVNNGQVNAWSKKLFK